MRLNATIGIEANLAQRSVLLGLAKQPGNLLHVPFPAKRKVRRGNNLDKVHVVEVRISSALAGIIKGILAVVLPREVVGGHLCKGRLWKLRAESEGVDHVGKVVLLAIRGLDIVLQVVDVHISVAEAAARSQMEVSNNLVNLEGALDATSFGSLRVQLLGVVFALTLLDVLSPAKSPRGLRVGFSNFVAAVTAPRLDSVAGGRRTVAVTAVCRVEMNGRIVMQIHSGNIDDTASFRDGLKADLIDAVFDTVLLLAGDIHHIESKELAWHFGKGHIEMDLHSLACTTNASVFPVSGRMAG